jgi:hypothetical protein
MLVMAASTFDATGDTLSDRNVLARERGVDHAN